MDTLSVQIESDDPLARSGLVALTAHDEGILIVSEDDSASHADVLLWDWGSGAPDDRSDKRHPLESDTPVLALCGDEAAAREALAWGVRGVVFRGADGKRLAAALRAVAQGLLVLDEGIALPVRRASSRRTVEALTPRELEVLELLSQGLSNKAIAARLGISEHTAKFHVNAILGKLGVQRRTEAIVRAARLGLIVI